MFSAGGWELQTRTGDIAGRWKEHFEELLNPANMSNGERAAPEDLAPKVVEKLLGDKAG